MQDYNISRKSLDEFSDNYELGLGIIKNSKVQKLDIPHIGFLDNKFYCHLYKIIDKSGNFITEYKKDNIEAYQYHPENSLLI